MNGKRRCCGEKGAGLAATSSSQRGDRLYKSTCTGGSGTRQNFEQFKAKNKGNTRPIVVFQFSNKKFEKICANPCGAKFKEDSASLKHPVRKKSGGITRKIRIRSHPRRLKRQTSAKKPTIPALPALPPCLLAPLYSWCWCWFR